MSTGRSYYCWEFQSRNKFEMKKGKHLYRHCSKSVTLYSVFLFLRWRYIWTGLIWVNIILHTQHLDIVFCTSLAHVPFFFFEHCTCLHSSQDSRWKIRLLWDILKGSLKMTIHLAGSMSEDVIKGFWCSQSFSDGLYVLGAFQKSHVYWNYLKTCQ